MRRRFMRKNILSVLFLVICPLLVSHPMLAKENWPLTVKVLNTKNIENEHGSFSLAWGGGSGAAGWRHRIAEHAFVEASDGNSYELVPNNPKDMLLPGTYQAKIEKRDMKVCEPKDNGNCREVKFKIVAAVPTVKEHMSTPEQAEPVPIPSPAQVASPSVVIQASVIIDSTPSGADIEIDGEFVGNTPSTTTVVPGRHKIVVKKKGYADWGKTMNVTGGTIHLNAELEQVQSQPPVAVPPPPPPPAN
jgi:diacylglycerol kinase family enzyme